MSWNSRIETSGKGVGYRCLSEILKDQGFRLWKMRKATAADSLPQAGWLAPLERCLAAAYFAVLARRE